MRARRPILWPVRQLAKSHDDVTARVEIYFDPF
jgi:hypothetical protein